MTTDGQPSTIVLVPPTPNTSTPTIPGYVPPLDTGQPSAVELNNLGTPPKQTFAARNTIIPITYGRDRLFGKPFVVHVDEANGFLYVAYGFCEGEIQGFETVFVEGIDINDSTEGFLLHAGAAVELHLGTPSQTVSTLLSAALAGYTDANINTAYIVIKAPKDSSQGFPKVEAIVQGRKVYDPRLDSTRTDITPVGSGAHRVGDASTWEFTTTPTLHFRDMVENFSAWDILDQGVVDCANFNEELVAGVSRREVGLTLFKASLIDKWAKGFRTYMGAFLGWEEGKIRVIPNRADVAIPGGIIMTTGNTQEIVIGNIAALDMNATQDFTIETSINMASLTLDDTIVSKKNILGGLADAGYILYASGGEITMQISDGTNEVDHLFSGAIAQSTWANIVVTIDRTADEMNLYIDSVAHADNPVDISSVTGSLGNANNFIIGNDDSQSDSFNGTLDEVRVWNDIRTAQEISDNQFNEILDPTSDASLVGYWKLNEDPTATIAIDSSSGGNDGTLGGTAVFGPGNPQIIPSGVVMNITADDIVQGSLVLTRRSLRNTPNSVAVDYEDSSGVKWHTERVQTDSARVTSGFEQRRLSRISLPGIHNASQAQREATERLNWYLTDLEAKLTLFDTGWQLQTGSVVSVTHPIGLDAKLFRVRKLTALSGRWTVDLVEYDSAIYSNEVIADPTTPDTSLGNPLNPPTVSGLSAAEELFRYKSGLTGSRVRASWDATNFPFLSQYLVEGYVDGTLVWQTFTQATSVVTPGVEELVGAVAVAYEIRVYIQSPFAQGTAATTNTNILGKLAVPGNVPTVDLTQTTADSIDIVWGEAVDIDIWRYEIRLGDPATNNTWELATKLELVDGLNYTTRGLSVGDHRLFVKARDSVGNESADAVSADITLSVPDVVASLNGFEVASEVRLNWPAVTTGFVERYRIAYSDIPETFETTLDIVDTLRFQTKDVPEGDFTFKVYARDKNGVEAISAATIDISVTSDADSFLADTHTFVNPTLTRMVEFDLRTDSRQLYVTNMADVFIAVSPSDFSNFSAEALANYHSSDSSEWLSETHDFILTLTGSWNLTHDVIALNGLVEVQLELSVDNIDFTVFTGAAKGGFRYARVRITTLASPGTATAFVKSPLMTLRINVVPLEESGEGTTSATAGVGDTQILATEYTALKEIVAQPKNKTDALTAIVDNIIIGPNTAIQSDGTNYLQGGNFNELDFTTGDFSIECYGKHSGGSNAQASLVVKRDGVVAGYALSVDEVTGEFEFVIDDGTNQITCTTVGGACSDDGDFHHIAVVVDRTGGQVFMYVDGNTTPNSTTDISSVTGSITTTSNFNVLADSVGANRGNLIDQLRVWNDIRTSTEVGDNYNIALDMTVAQAGLVGLWLMDGSVGTAVTTVADISGNANTLTDTGAGALVYIDPGVSGNLVQKINSFDVFIFDIFGQQLAEDYQWKWKAI